MSSVSLTTQPPSLFQIQDLLEHQIFPYLPYQYLSSCQRVCTLFQKSLTQILKNDQARLQTIGTDISLETLAKTGLRSLREFVQIATECINNSQINETLALGYLAPFDQSTGSIQLETSIGARNMHVYPKHLTSINAIFPHRIAQRMESGNYSLSLVQSSHQSKREIIPLIDQQQANFFTFACFIRPPLPLLDSDPIKIEALRKDAALVEPSIESLVKMLEIAVRERQFISSPDDSIGIQITEILSCLVDFYKKLQPPHTSNQHLSLEIKTLNEILKTAAVFQKIQEGLPSKKEIFHLLNHPIVKNQILLFLLNIKMVLDLHPKYEKSGKIDHLLTPDLWKWSSEIILTLRDLFKTQPQFETERLAKKYVEDLEAMKLDEELFNLKSYFHEGLQSAILRRNKRLEDLIEDRIEQEVQPQAAPQAPQPHDFNTLELITAFILGALSALIFDLVFKANRGQ